MQYFFHHVTVHCNSKQVCRYEYLKKTTLDLPSWLRTQFALKERNLKIRNVTWIFQPVSQLKWCATFLVWNKSWTAMDFVCNFRLMMCVFVCLAQETVYGKRDGYISGLVKIHFAKEVPAEMDVSRSLYRTLQRLQWCAARKHWQVWNKEIMTKQKNRIRISNK